MAARCKHGFFIMQKVNWDKRFEKGALSIIVIRFRPQWPNLYQSENNKNYLCSIYLSATGVVFIDAMAEKCSFKIKFRKQSYISIINIGISNKILEMQ